MELVRSVALGPCQLSADVLVMTEKIQAGDPHVYPRIEILRISCYLRG
jgi:hypothetical protein